MRRDFTWITAFFGGRSTFFALVFLICGITLAFRGKLTMEYVGLAAAVQTLLVTRAVFDDYHARKSAELTGGTTDK